MCIPLSWGGDANLWVAEVQAKQTSVYMDKNEQNLAVSARE